MEALREGWARLRSPISNPRFVSEGRSAASLNPMVTYYLIVIPALVLAIIGMLMGFSAQTVSSIFGGENPYLDYMKPLLVILGGLLIAYGVHKIPIEFFKTFSYPVFVFALILQSLVLTPLGREEGGNVNWVWIPGLPFLIQPSELLKLALLLVLAKSLTHPGARLHDWRQMLVKAGGLLGLALVFVMFGHDMGTAMVVAGLALGALWVAGLPSRWFGVVILAAMPVLGIFIGKNPTRIQRILEVLPGNTERNISKPEQIDHSLWAFGSGGFTGLGPGASREKWDYLQAAHTDFILAIIGEEFGLLGSIAVLVTIALLVWGLVRVCQAAKDPYAVIVAGGVATWIGFQTIINVFSVTRVGPVVGVPLPLVSHGGSSFLFTVIGIAVIASFARADTGMTMWGQSHAFSWMRDPRKARRRRRADRGSVEKVTEQ